MEFDFSVLDLLQEQYHKQRTYLAQSKAIANRPALQRFLKHTHDMIETVYHLQYNDKLGKWTKTRKPRLRPLQDNKVVEMWVLSSESARDQLCTRFEGELYNQGQGPYPDVDTHPHCKCSREIVAIPNDKGRLSWAVKKPRNKRRPKIKVPRAYQEPINPYDIDSPRAPQPTF